MKRTFFVATALLTVCGTLAFAQQTAPAPASPDQQQFAGGRPHHHNPHREAARMSKELNLTPDQTARLEPILADRDQKMTDLHANTSLSPQDMHQQQHAIVKSTRDQLAGVLSPDQMQQLRAIHRDHGQHHEQGQPAPAPPSGV